MNIFSKFFKDTTTQTLHNTDKVLFSNDFLIVGENYECRKNKKKLRRDVIKKMKVNDVVLIEQYIYNGKPAYMVIDPRTNLDLGVLSQGTAKWLSEDYPNAQIDAYLLDKYKNSFHVKVRVIEKQ